MSNWYMVSVIYKIMLVLEENIANSLPYSYFNKLSKEISTIRSQTQAMLCLARQLPTARHYILLDTIYMSEEQRKQHDARNFQNISTVSLVLKNSKCINFLIAELKWEFLYFYIE
jgi:hypothetical protein